MAKAFVRVNKPTKTDGQPQWDETKIRPLYHVGNDQQGNIFAVVPNDKGVLSKVDLGHCVDATEEFFESERQKFEASRTAEEISQKTSENTDAEESTETAGDNNTGGTDTGSVVESDGPTEEGATVTAEAGKTKPATGRKG